MKPTLKAHQTNGHSKNYNYPLSKIIAALALTSAGILIVELYYRDFIPGYYSIAAILVGVSFAFLYVLLQRRYFTDEWTAYVRDPASRLVLKILAYAMALPIGLSVFLGRWGQSESATDWLFLLFPLVLTAMHVFIFSRFLLRIPGERKRVIEQDRVFKVTEKTRPEDELTEDDEEWRKN